MTEIEAIPTVYHGISMRSMLEADWAYTLDNLGIKWKYEPKQITLPGGAIYIPDFWLPEIGTWIETKGYGVGREWKARKLADVVLCHCKGRCTCQWYGGEIVLLGRAGRDYGTKLAWEDALGVNTFLAACSECHSYSWRRIRHSLRCRKCGSGKATYPLASSGEPAFFHAPKETWELPPPPVSVAHLFRTAGR